MSEIQNTKTVTIESIVAKLDNDFNPDNSDWIPRVGAWCMDAMSQIDATRTSRKRKRLTVRDKIAYAECGLDDNITVYDENGCKVKKMENTNADCCGSSFTGDETKQDKILRNFTPETVDIIKTGFKRSPNYVRADTINEKYPYRYNVHHFFLGGMSPKERNYVVLDNNKIELNYDADYVDVETEYVETETSDTLGCEVPVIPKNGLLIEWLTYYCMWKMLTRGYKHPVMSLAASQYGTNPYYLWKSMKDEVERSIKNNSSDEDEYDDASRMMRSGMVIDMFDGRR